MLSKLGIRSTHHYLEFHSDVEWDLVITTILSPTKCRPNKRHGKDRYTYVKRFREFVVEVHAEKDRNGNIWVINAFRMER